MVAFEQCNPMGLCNSNVWFIAFRNLCSSPAAVLFPGTLFERSIEEVETIIHRYGFLLGIHAKKRVDWYAVDECKMILKLMVIGG